MSGVSRQQIQYQRTVSDLRIGFVSNFLAKLTASAQTVVVLETEGSVWKIQKGYFFTTKKIKKSTPNLTSPYVQNLFGITLIKQTFEKNKSPKAASGSQIKF